MNRERVEELKRLAQSLNEGTLAELIASGAPPHVVDLLVALTEDQGHEIGDDGKCIKCGEERAPIDFRAETTIGAREGVVFMLEMPLAAADVLRRALSDSMRMAYEAQDGCYSLGLSPIREGSETAPSCEPMLGAATTKQLLEELAVRMEATQNSTAGRRLAVHCREALSNFYGHVLNYRTVD